ncbi:MAG: YolA family protein [Rhodocyclales bacterium]|nr:YolA family protein [Rhodocyclales bacterium]
MKNAKLVKLALTAATLLTCHSSFAADIEAGVVKRIPEHERQPLMAGGSPLDLSKLAINPVVSTAEGKMGIQGAAPGISEFRIYAVQSRLGGTEYPTLYTGGITRNDHGGNPIQVFVLQYGYGNPTTATLNGVTGPAYRRTLCGTPTFLHYCNVGETVTGWLYQYDFYNQSSGIFTVGAYSIGYPYGYWSTTIYVR